MAAGQDGVPLDRDDLSDILRTTIDPSIAGQPRKAART